MTSHRTEAESPLLAKDDFNTEKGAPFIAERNEKHTLSDYRVEAWR